MSLPVGSSTRMEASPMMGSGAAHAGCMRASTVAGRSQPCFILVGERESGGGTCRGWLGIGEAVSRAKAIEQVSWLEQSRAGGAE